MATGISLASTSNLTTGQKIVVNAARLAYEPAAPNPDLVEVHRMPEGHKQWDILTYARLSDATALTEGTDLAQYEQLVAATLTVTPTEHGILANVSNRLIRRQGDLDVLSATGTMLANSLRRLQDKDIITLFDGFSKSVVGASLTLDITHFRGSVAYLLTDNDSSYGPAPMPVHASLHIEQISDIILDVSDPGTAAGNRPVGFGEELMQRWWRGRDRLYGVMIWHGGNISRDSSSDSKGAIFAREALALVIANTADPVQERDISLRALEIGIFQEWSEAERADPHGVEVYSDTTATV
jgi:hypothetical protein